MCRFKTIFLYIFLLYCPACFFMTASDIVLEKKETLYSTKNGRPIGDISLSIEAKSVDSNPKEFYLIIGDKNTDIVEGGKSNRSLWFFNRKITLNDLKKEVKSQDINLDAKGYRELEPLSDTGIKFEMRNWNELKRQTKYMFSVDAPIGREVILKLHFYVASADKKTTTIDDDARITVSFTVPSPESLAAGQPRTASPAPTAQSPAQNRTQSPSPNYSPQNDQGGVVNLSETIGSQQQGMREDETSDADLQKQLQAQALAQAEELNKRKEEVDVLITVKNKEMASLLIDLEELVASKRKIPAKELDSIELVLSEMRKRVEFLDRGYTDVLLKDEAIQNKFTKFSSDQTVASKQLAEIRGKATSTKDLLMKIGIIAGVVMMFVMLLMQILRPFLSKKKMAKLQAAQMKMMQGQSQVKGVGSSATSIQSTISKI